jgi:hypothetical protein
MASGRPRPSLSGNNAFRISAISAQPSAISFVELNAESLEPKARMVEGMRHEKMPGPETTLIQANKEINPWPIGNATSAATR